MPRGPGVFVVLLMAATTTAQNVARPCQYDSDCVSNGYCFMNSYCRCKQGYVITGSYRNNTLACLKEAAVLGDACSLNIQCSRPFGAHALCLAGGACDCREDAHFREDLCYPSVRIGGQCTVRNDCRVGPSTIDAACVRGTCMCQPGFHGGPQGRDCVPDVLLGDRCQVDGDCSTPNSTCSGEVCRCVVDHVGNSRNTRCLRFAQHLGDTCEEDTQCSELLENSVCGDSGVCSCAELYQAVSEDSSCWQSVPLNNPCSDNSDCYWLLDSRCSSGFCTCDEGLVAEYAEGSSASCVKLAVYAGERCSSDAKCRGLGDNAHCVPDATNQGHCLCDNNHHFLQGKCWRSISLGERCSGDADCYLKRDVHRVSCNNSTCKCVPVGWFVPSEDKLSCVDSASGVAATVSSLLVGVVAAMMLGRP